MNIALIVIAVFALLLTIIGGVWKLASMLTKIETHIEEHCKELTHLNDKVDELIGRP